MLAELTLLESERVGTGTKILANAYILPGAKIGRDCNICDGVYIENDIKIADRVTIKCGVQLWDGITVEDDVFIGPNATFTNDIFPRSKRYPQVFDNTVLKRRCSVGANGTILCGIEIGENDMVGAGSVVTKNVSTCAVVYGNPATVQRYSEASNV